MQTELIKYKIQQWQEDIECEELDDSLIQMTNEDWDPFISKVLKLTKQQEQ